MATLKDIQRKIGAVKKTKQITRAMNMVAAARLRGAQDKMEKFRPYAGQFNEVLADLSSRTEPDVHPLLMAVDEVKKVDLILLTADRGLCGSFNINLSTTAERFIRERRGDGVEVLTYAIGRRGRDYLKRRKYEFHDELTGVMSAADMELVMGVGRAESQRFISGDADEVWLVYSRFVNMATQVPTLEKLLPISPPAKDESAEEVGGSEYLMEPSAEEIIFELLPRSVNVRIFQALLETNTAEHAARMTAMDNATSACSDMIEQLTLAYNKARQAAITAELMDIVGGAEALAQA